MVLLVDAGNTRVKWALVDAREGKARLGGWERYGAVMHDGIGTLAEAWASLPITRAVLCNVAGAGMRTQLQCALQGATGLRPVPMEWFAAAPGCAGVSNGYRTPAQLGADRFASLIGARALYPAQALLVVTCGTATTIDGLTQDGAFIGGMILPGLGLMAQSLARNTAQLPQVGAPVAVPLIFADNTDDAIVSGCIGAQAGAIERALAAFARQCGQTPRCVLSGGAGPMIAPHLSVPADTVDNLVLLGLHRAILDSTSC